MSGLELTRSPTGDGGKMDLNGLVVAKLVVSFGSNLSVNVNCAIYTVSTVLEIREEGYYRPVGNSSD